MIQWIIDYQIIFAFTEHELLDYGRFWIYIAKLLDYSLFCTISNWAIGLRQFWQKMDDQIADVLEYLFNTGVLAMIATLLQ